LTRIKNLLNQVAPHSQLQRRFSRSAAELEQERHLAEARSKRSLPNLNRYGHLTFLDRNLSRSSLLEIVKRLASDPAVETAFLEPIAVPAALGFDAFTVGHRSTPATAGSRVSDRQDPNQGEEVSPKIERGPQRGPARVLVDSPDFSGQQGYLGPAPEGIGALAVAGNAGALAPNVKVIDVEGAWLWAHEDLPDPFATLGTPIDDADFRNHGTAVLGEIRGTDNGFGVRGIVPACAVGASSIADQSVAEAINNAAATLDPGDIILIELHAPGPNANGQGQFGYLCLEFWQDVFDAIFLASASGVIVCEAAGNGEQDLDDPVYLGLFDRSVRDSGAILCGATHRSTLYPAWFSNHGSRVDLSGWGSEVTTCAYGDLQGYPDFPEEQWYTASFNGTSSASPIVVGAVASLQGMTQAAFGFDLDARLARDILVQTGTTTLGPQQVGPRPDLVAAWTLASSGIGEVAGTVTDFNTGLPVSAAKIVISETGNFDLTAEDGTYRIPLLVGAYNLEASSFFHQTQFLPTTVSHGATTTLDVVLDPRPSVVVSGRVYGEMGSPLPGVRVDPLGVPLNGTVTDAEGRFAISPVPEDYEYNLLFDNVPGYGATLKMVSTFSPPGPEVTLRLGLPVATEDFETGDGGFVADNEVWSYGTPAAGGPEGSGFSGTQCWGVGMTGNYEDEVTGILTGPVYDFTGGGFSALFLSFHYWSDTEGGFDGVHLEVWGGQEWDHRVPLEGYSDITLGGIGYQGGWSGDTGTWRGTVFDFTDFIGSQLQFRLVFGSDVAINAPGFWIDGIAFDTGDLLTSVDSPADPPPPIGPTLVTFPNPFNPKVTIGWEIPQTGSLAIEVFDLRGRRVRTLLRGKVNSTRGTVNWDGRDATGQLAASGVYLVQLRLEDGTAAAQRVILTK
jgi:hypothetical protein